MPDGLSSFGPPEQDKLVRTLSACLTVLHVVAEDNASAILCMLGTAVESTLKAIDNDEERSDATVAFLEMLCTRMGFVIERDEE
jgi:hypothetical protein